MTIALGTPIGRYEIRPQVVGIIAVRARRELEHVHAVIAAVYNVLLVSNELHNSFAIKLIKAMNVSFCGNAVSSLASFFSVRRLSSCTRVSTGNDLSFLMFATSSPF